MGSKERTGTMNEICARGVVIALMTVIGSGAAADPPSDDMKSAMLGSLVYTCVDVELQGVSVQEALRLLGDAIGWGINHQWQPADAGANGQPPPRISLRARDISALLALEMIIAQSCETESVTWQVGNGTLEIGSKQRLATLEEFDFCVYDLSDLLLDKAYFVAPQFGADAILRRGEPPDTESFNTHPLRPAALLDGMLHATYEGMMGKMIRADARLNRALARGFVDLIVPGNWNFGDQLDNVLPGSQRYRPRRSRELEPCIATLRLVTPTSISVGAPGFVHRDLGGYPKPARPTAEHVASILSNQTPARTAPFVRFCRVADGPLELGSLRAPGNRRAGAEDAPPRESDVALFVGLRTADSARRCLALALRSRTVSVNYKSTRSAEAFASLGQIAGLPIIVRTIGDANPWGMSPDLPLSLRLHEASVLNVLEALVAQCSALGNECTWQIRPGFIEVGAKRDLSADAARELRLYNVRDLLLEAPDMYANPLERRLMGANRKPSETLSLDFVETVVGTIEPRSWDWGQPLEVARDMGLEAPPDSTGTTPSDSRPMRSGQPGPSRWGRRYAEHPTPAVIRCWGDVVLVLAPDYIHRQLGGYGPNPK